MAKNKFKIGQRVKTRHTDEVNALVTAVIERENKNYSYECSIINDGLPTTVWISQVELEKDDNIENGVGF